MVKSARWLGLFTALWLSGCGQSGPLTLPEKTVASNATYHLSAQLTP